MSFCKNRTLKQTLLASAVLLALSTQASHAVITLTFTDYAGTTDIDAYPATLNNPGSGTPFITSFGAGNEFRMISPFASIGGGGEKDIIKGDTTEIWTFSDAGVFTAVSGMPQNSGAANSPVAPTAGTNDALHQIAPFFGGDFTFLAPVSGSLAATAYGASTINFDPTGKTLTITHGVLEAQWGGTYFPLGSVDDINNSGNGLGITMSGSYTCSPANCSGDPVSITFVITGEELIDAAEDPGAGGFAQWTAQWLLSGTGSVPAAVLTPPASPASAYGTLNPTAGGPADGNATNDGRMTKAESEAASWGADPGDDGNGDGTKEGMVETCVGGCFDFTVTGLSSGQQDQIILNLPIPIPAGAVYRKYNDHDGDGTETWHDFDTSTGDSVVSGTGTSTSCASVAYGSGLTAGDYCVRLSITDGGPNDRDGLANGTIVDPGGVGVKAVAPPPPRTGSSLDNAKGCSMSTVPVDPSQRADWWLVAGFLGALAWLRRKRHAA